MATEPNAFRAELCTILGCKDKYIATRLKFINKLNTCGRCGGGGHYSYCAMYGTTCFQCSGSGVAMPKLTAKFVKEVKAAWTPDVAAAYAAKMAHTTKAKAECKKFERRYLDSRVIARLRMLLIGAGLDTSGWEAQVEWEKANCPEVYALRNRLYDLEKTWERKLRDAGYSLYRGTKTDPATKAVAPIDWTELAAFLAPFFWEADLIDAAA